MRASGLLITRLPVPLRNRVVERLRLAIREQLLPEGSRLVERQLCEMLGVSRTLVREALRQLEAEGLVTIVPHRGPSVARLDRATVKGIYEVRGVLEALAGRLFVERATAADRRRLAEAFAGFERAHAAHDSAASLRETSRFYNVLFAGARNPVIPATLRPLSGRIHLLRARSFAMPGRKEESYREMKAILEAALGHHPQQAWSCCLLHVENAARYALNSFEDEAGRAQANAAIPLKRTKRKYGKPRERNP